MIPQELRRLKQWVVARDGWKGPLSAYTAEPISVSDPNEWADYEMASYAIERTSLADYVGFVFNNNGIVGIDLDQGYDEDGMITKEAAEVIRRFGSYTEKSRSGRGFHILVRGVLPFSGRNNRAGVEAYQSGRYFIMTGKTVKYTQIVENQEAIDWLVTTHFPEMEKVSLCGARAPRQYNPEWVKPEGGKIKLRPVYPAIPHGCRNICLTSLGGLMHNTGYSPDQIYAELCYANETACQPMISNREIENIVSSVTRYKR